MDSTTLVVVVEPEVVVVVAMPVVLELVVVVDVVVVLELVVVVVVVVVVAVIVVVGASVVEEQIEQPVQSHSLLSCSHVAAPGGINDAISSQVLGSSGGPQTAGHAPRVVAAVVVVAPV